MRKIYVTVMFVAMFATTLLANGLNQTTVVAGSEAMPTDIITAQPAGTLHKNMYLTAKGWKLHGSGLFLLGTSTDGGIADAVFGNDGYVYIKNPVSEFLTDTWIKGQLNQADGTVVFKFPQKIKTGVDATTGKTQDFYVQALKKNANADGFVLNDKNEVMFTWKNGILAKSNPDLMLGITDESGLWQGKGDTEITMSDITEQPSAPADPSKAVENSMDYIYTNLKREDHVAFVKVVKEGDYLFVQGLDPNINDGWIKGTISNGEVTFSKQYIGASEEHRYQSFFIPTKIVYQTNDAYMPVPSYRQMDNLVFDYDEETGIFQTKTYAEYKEYQGSKGVIKNTEGAIINVGKTNVTPVFAFHAAKFTYFEDKAVEPLSPKILSAEQYTAKNGYGTVKFSLPVTDVDGKPLKTEKLFYKIYLDGEALTFTKDLYAKIPETMTEVPYAYADDYDFITNGTTRTVYFYKEANSIGVQSVYKGGGASKASEITTKDFGATGINHATTENSAVVSEVYYDISGRKVSHPVQGVYVKVEKMADGTVIKTKVVKR